MKSFLVLGCVLLVCWSDFSQVRADTIVIADLSGRRLARFNGQGQWLGKRDASYPSDISTDYKGNLYVVSARGLWMHNPAGVPVRQLRGPGPSHENLFGPTACGQDGSVYAINQYNNTLVRFTPSGRYDGVVCSTGIQLPDGMAADYWGSLYVANGVGIRKLTTSGQDLGTIIPGLAGVSAITCDRFGYLYVNIKGSGAIRKYDGNGQDLGLFAQVGYDPEAIAFDSANCLLAARADGWVKRFSYTGADLGVLISQGVSLVEGMVVQRSFEREAGSYAGLSNDGEAAFELTLNATGTFTGKLRVPGEPAATVRGKMNHGGYFFGRFGSSQRALELFTWIPDNATRYEEIYLTGWVDGRRVDGYHHAYQTGDSLSETGRFHLLLPPSPASTELPPGQGYVVQVIGRTGAARLSGRLADGTAMTGSGRLVGSASGAREQVIFNTLLYGSRGLLGGRARFEFTGSRDVAGLLEWRKPLTTQGMPLPFAGELTMEGARYVVPASGQPALSGSQWELVFQNGDLGDSFAVDVSADGQGVMRAAAGNPEAVRLTVNRATGSVSGQFLHPALERVIRFQGLVFQHPNAARAGGYFLSPVGPNLLSGGRFDLAP